MADKRVTAVVGATGMPGGGLVRALLADREYGMTVRALTRDVNSDKAKEFARLGAEVVTADVHDVGSLERAFTVPHFDVKGRSRSIVQAARPAGDLFAWLEINKARIPRS